LNCTSQPKHATTKQYDFLNRLSSIASTPSNSFAYLYNAANQRTMAKCAEDGTQTGTENRAPRMPAKLKNYQMLNVKIQHNILWSWMRVLIATNLGDIKG
jgi:hypothetical protein